MLVNAKRQHGVGLIEILISLLVLSIGLLGMSALQINASKQSHSLMLRTQAINLAYDIADRLRVNSTQAFNDNYLVAINSEKTAFPAPAVGTTNIAISDIRDFFDKAESLPGGDFSIGAATQVINGLPARRFTIQICWQDPYTRDQALVVDQALCGVAGKSGFSFLAGI